MYVLYIVRCSDDSLYTGITNNLKKRIKSHNEGKGAKYTRGRTPVKLVYYEIFEDRSSATKAEIKIKNLSKKQKETIVQNFKK